MAATGFTPIQLYRSATPGVVPTAGNLADGELALNTADEKLFFKNAGGSVVSIDRANGTVTSVAASGGTTGLTFSGSPITTSGTLTLSGTLTVANGGTGATSLTNGFILRGNGTSAVSASNIFQDTFGNIGIGTTSLSARLMVNGGTGNSQTRFEVNTTEVQEVSTNAAQSAYANRLYDAAQHIWKISNSEAARLTSAGYLEGVFSDDVVALGNSGTATSIDLRQGTVFTATLTGNCTFTLTNPNANANRGTSFTLVLTNDGTAGRTVAWAGGSFRFPGGASSLSRTTTANAVDIWAFFTPDNGTTWYGNIVMKDVKA